jgi:hypothetical protein
VTILGRMLRRRRLKVAYLLSSLLLLAASLHAPTAYSAAGDPPSGSPAGSVYQLPLEQGRSDAAPKGSGGTGAGGGGESGGSAGGAAEPSESDSLYRTENNFGSSSHVPGVAGTGGGGSGAAAGDGSGAGSAAIAGGAVAAESADTGNTSVTAGIVLIAAIALLAVAAGVLSRRFRGRARAS